MFRSGAEALPPHPPDCHRSAVWRALAGITDKGWQDRPDMADRADLFARFIAWGSREGHEDHTRAAKGRGCITSWCARGGLGAGAGINKVVKHISRMTARMRRIAPRAFNRPRARLITRDFLWAFGPGAVRQA